MNVIDRIKARVVVNENGCHVFQGNRHHRGYGRISLGSRAQGEGYTHRLMYAAAHGPIPDGLHIDHLCRNRSCCNPEHLEAVTQAENNRRAASANDNGARGVYLTRQSSKNPWRAEIHAGGRAVHIGLFPTREAAVAARQAALHTERRAAIEAEVKALEAGAS